MLYRSVLTPFIKQSKYFYNNDQLDTVTIFIDLMQYKHKLRKHLILILDIEFNLRKWIQLISHPDSPLNYQSKSGRCICCILRRYVYMLLFAYIWAVMHNHNYHCP